MSTPRYPQGNGQDEASNKTILDCLKKSLTDKKGKWPNELPGCLWEYCTTKRRATCETLFSLAFGSEAIIPPNIIVPNIISLLPSIEQNNKEMTTSLDLAEEKCEQTITRIVAYLQQLISSYNKRAKIQQFQPEDLVLGKAFITARREGSEYTPPSYRSQQQTTPIIRPLPQNNSVVDIGTTDNSYAVGKNPSPQLIQLDNPSAPSPSLWKSVIQDLNSPTPSPNFLLPNFTNHPKFQIG